jgi:putative redox protein
MSETMTVSWEGGMLFTAKDDLGWELRSDARENVGGSESAPGPVAIFYFATGACTGMDVVSILRKMKQDVTSYSVTVEAERPSPEYPKPVERLRLTHKLSGNGLNRELVEKAVRLSDQKYCPIIASLRRSAQVVSETVIE